MKIRSIGFALVWVSILSVAPPSLAQEEASEPSAPRIEVPAGPADPFDRGVPQTAMLGYLQAAREGDFAKAAEYLDLRRLPRESWPEKGPELARRLKVVLDKTLWVEVDGLSRDERGASGDGLESYRDAVGTIETAHGLVTILLQRVPRGDGVSIWKVSSETVAEIPALWSEFGYGPLERWLPDWMLGPSLFDIAFWQWLALMALIVAVFAVSWVAASAVLAVGKPLVRRSKTDIDDRLLDAALGPLRLVVGILFFHLGMIPLGFAVPIRNIFVNLEKASLVLVATWLLFRLIDALAAIIQQRAAERGRAPVAHFVPLGQRTLKAVVGGLAFLAAIDTIGFDVTALIAGLGVGGIAVALAAQKTIENLFGGITIIGDQPVRPGDFCRFGDRVGTVEEIGLRSTRVRTLDRTVVTIPNADFASMQLENFAHRDRIRYNPQLGLRYETTPDQIRYVLSEVRRVLYSHPKVLEDPARVRFAGFGDFSLNVEIVAYVDTRDWAEYLEIAEDLNLRIMDVIAEAGTGFAFPSSTTYLAKDDGIDEERGRAAEAQVEAWRKTGDLNVPRFSPEEIERLRGTLEYPPAGAAMRNERSGAGTGGVGDEG